MIRSSRPRLHDITTNIALVLDLARNRSQDHLRTDTPFRYAVLHALMIIGEAVRHLPKEALSPFPGIPWRDIVGMGVLIKHEYHRVDPAVVWNTITEHLPPLNIVVKRMLTDLDQPAPPL